MYAAPPKPLVDRLVCSVSGENQRGDPIQIADASLEDSGDIAIFEMKAVWLPDKHVEIADPADYLRKLTDLYARFETDGKSPKGAGQLARSITNVANGNWTAHRSDLLSARTIYPVILCYDPLIGAAAHPWHLAEQFRDALEPDQILLNGEMLKGSLRVAGLIILSLNDLETLETSVEHFSLMDLFRDYARDNPERLCSLHDYLAMSEYGTKLFASRSLASSALAALESVKDFMES